MPYITTSTSGWADVYALSGIAPGTAVYVQNQSSEVAYSQRTGTAPLATDNTGRRVRSDEEVLVDAGALGLFMRCSPNGVRLYVQVAQT